MLIIKHFHYIVENYGIDSEEAREFRSENSSHEKFMRCASFLEKRIRELSPENCAKGRHFSDGFHCWSCGARMCRELITSVNREGRFRGWVCSREYGHSGEHADRWRDRKQDDLKSPEKYGRLKKRRKIRCYVFNKKVSIRVILWALKLAKRDLRRH